jgi:hypothetical protein
VQVGIEPSDLVLPPIVVGIVLVVVRFDRNLKWAVCAGT